MKFKTKRRLILGISIFLLLFLYLFKNYSSVIRVGSFIFGMCVFYFFDHAFNVRFRFRHYVYIIIILFFGMLLSPLYVMFDIYDKVLHLIMPIFASVLFFFIVNKTKLELKYKLLITFTSVVTALVILEVGEYIIDYFWNFELQGVFLRDSSGLTKYKLILDRNDDTMIDLMLGIGGSILFAAGKFVAYYYHKISK